MITATLCRGKQPSILLYFQSTFLPGAIERQMACGIYQRERCVAAEMEACWEPINSKESSLPGCDPQNDPFCPLVRAGSRLTTRCLCQLCAPFDAKARDAHLALNGVPRNRKNVICGCCPIRFLKVRMRGRLREERHTPSSECSPHQNYVGA